MKTILTLLLVLVPGSSFAGDDPVAELRAELRGLNLSSPETDAQRDIATDHVRCFSVNGYTKVFPGVSVQDRSYCVSRENNFLSTSEEM